MRTPEEFLADLATLCEEMVALRTGVSQAMSEADQRVSEIYHEVERINFNAVQGFLLAQRLKKALIHRRNVKREQEMVTAVLPLTSHLLVRHREALK